MTVSMQDLPTLYRDLQRRVGANAGSGPQSAFVHPRATWTEHEFCGQDITGSVWVNGESAVLICDPPQPDVERWFNARYGPGRWPSIASRLGVPSGGDAR